MTYQNLSIKDEPASPATLGNLQNYHLMQVDPNTVFQFDHTSPRYPANDERQVVQMMPASSNLQMSPPGYREAAVLPEADGDKKPSATISMLKRKVLQKREDLRTANLFEEPTEFQMTAAEVAKRERRKEQNRNAAKKCRQKKRKLQEEATKGTEKMDQENKAMETEILHLRHEVNLLQGVLVQHVESGTCSLPQPIRRVLHGTVSADNHTPKRPKLSQPLQPVGERQQAPYQVCVQPAPQTQPIVTAAAVIPKIIFSDGPASTAVTSGLPSWDLDNITPDLTLQGGSTGTIIDVNDYIMEDPHLFSQGSEEKKFTHSLNMPGVSNQNMSAKPSCVRNLTQQFSDISSTIVNLPGSISANEEVHVPQQCQSDINQIHVPEPNFLLRPHSSELANNQMPTSQDNHAQASEYLCVSPNLIQPSYSTSPFSPSTDTANINTGLSEMSNIKHNETWKYQTTEYNSNTNNNNNTGGKNTNKQTTKPRALPSISSFTTATSDDGCDGSIFTFDVDMPTCPSHSFSVSGQEPQSPFLAACFNSRGDLSVSPTYLDLP